MVNRHFRIGYVLIFVILFSLVAPIRSRADTTTALSVRSVGLFDTDGTVLYSVLIASKADPLSKLTITSQLPEKTAFVELIATPPNAIAKQDAKSVTWLVEKLDKDTILGPFTYRVKLADKASEAPANVAAKVSWEQPSAGTAEAKVEATRIKPLAEVGTLVLDEKGTLDDKGVNTVVTIGDTGIQFYAPTGAVSQKTTLTFTRIPVDAKSTPSGIPDYWWCASVKITADPVVQFTKPFSLSLPTRRTLTPGMPAQFFTLGADGKWQTLGTEPQSSANFAKPDFRHKVEANMSAGITSNGNGIMVIAVSHSVAQISSGITFTGGVNDKDRKNANIAGANLPTSRITDGTSNTIASRYIEQDNIIAVLIGSR